MLNDLANQGAITSGLLGGSPYGNDPAGAQGMTAQQVSDANMRRMQIAQAQMMANPPLVASQNGPGAFRKASRLSIDVDKVTNGFTLKSSTGDLLIAKNLEELQGLFVSQVAAMLLEDE